MKIRFFIISVLVVLLAILSILCLGRTKSVDPLVAEEMALYHNRKEVTSLSTPAEKAAYSLGMAHSLSNLQFDNRSEQYLATFYNIVANPENQYYYNGLRNTPLTPLNLNLWIPNADIPLNVESFVAGYAQTMEKKILIPELTGEAGQLYLNSATSKYK